MAATALVVQERILERRSSTSASAESGLLNLLAEVVQVFKGGLMPVVGRAAEVDGGLRRDLGID